LRYHLALTARFLCLSVSILLPLLFFLLLRPPPSSPLFPYTTLFRSHRPHFAFATLHVPKGRHDLFPSGIEHILQLGRPDGAVDPPGDLRAEGTAAADIELRGLHPAHGFGGAVHAPLGRPWHAPAQHQRSHPDSGRHQSPSVHHAHPSGRPVD